MVTFKPDKPKKLYHTGGEKNPNQRNIQFKNRRYGFYMAVVDLSIAGYVAWQFKDSIIDYSF